MVGVLEVFEVSEMLRQESRKEVSWHITLRDMSWLRSPSSQPSKGLRKVSWSSKPSTRWTVRT
jgi:hypothetical protein